jgi:hypothetical protein
VGVAVTLCAQPEHERPENENHHSFLRGSEKQSLSGLLEFGTPAFFQLAKAFGVNSQFDLTTDDHESTRIYKSDEFRMTNDEMQMRKAES